MKLRHALITSEPKYKKNKKYAHAESDVDDDWIAEYEESLQAKEIEKAEKKFAKDTEKAAEEGKPAPNQKELNERIAEIKADYKRLKKEQGTGKATLKRERAADKIEEAIAKLDERIANAKLQMVDREEGKEVALGTRLAYHQIPVYAPLLTFVLSAKSTISTLGMPTSLLRCFLT